MFDAPAPDHPELQLAEMCREFAAANDYAAFDAFFEKWSPAITALDADALPLLSHWIAVSRLSAPKA